IMFNGYAPVPLPTIITAFDGGMTYNEVDDATNEYLDEIRKAEDEDEALEALEGLQEHNWEEFIGYIKLGDYYSFGAKSQNLKGVTNFDGIVLWNTYLED